MTDALDEALDLLDDTAAEFGGGLSNHGPMAAEALARLGRDDAVVRWTNRYRRRLAPIDATGPMAGRTAALTRTFAERPWRAVLTDVLPSLLPGLMASATHGAIRVAHAARALEERDNDLRRRELAKAIAYWEASYLELPGVPCPSGTRRARDALAAVPLSETRLRDALITEQVMTVDPASFGQAVDALDPATTLDDVIDAAAAAYLANERVAWIAFVHTITGPSALRLLLPYLDPSSTGRATAYAWQCVAALQAGYGRAAPHVTAAADDGDDVDWEDLADHAVASDDEHVIKLLEACRREHEARPSPLLVAAACRVTGAR